MLRSPLFEAMTTSSFVFPSEPGAPLGQRKSSGSWAASTTAPEMIATRAKTSFCISKEWVVGFFLFHRCKRAVAGTNQRRAGQRKDLFADFLFQQVRALEATAH